MSYLHDLAKSRDLDHRAQSGSGPQGYRPVRAGWISWRHGIQFEKLVWLMALGCAVLLLFAPLSPRATWVHAGGDLRGDAGSISTGRAWAFVVFAMAIVAICSLAIGAVNRQKRIIPSLCSALAAVAYGIAALSCGAEISHRAAWTAGFPEYALSSTGWADAYVVIAFVGVAGSIGLTIQWLKSARDDW